MCAVLGRSMQIVVEAVGLYLDARYCLGREFGRQRLLHLGLAEGARTGAGDADAHSARAEIGDVDTDQREARRGVPELHVGATLRDLERHRRDELTWLQRSFVQTLEVRI